MSLPLSLLTIKMWKNLNDLFDGSVDSWNGILKNIQSFGERKKGLVGADAMIFYVQFGDAAKRLFGLCLVSELAIEDLFKPKLMICFGGVST